VTAAQTDAMPMQRFAASACRGPALTRPDLGRLHSSATGVAEPDPDASYVANAIVRRAPAGRGKAIVRTAAAARSRLGESDRAPQRRSGWILASALSPRQSSAARRRDGKKRSCGPRQRDARDWAIAQASSHPMASRTGRALSRKALVRGIARLPSEPAPDADTSYPTEAEA
jgi:hypothetical protein